MSTKSTSHSASCLTRKLYFQVGKLVVDPHPRAAFADGRVVAEGLHEPLRPRVVLPHPGELGRREEEPGPGLGATPVGVEAVVAYLLEPLVRHVDQQLRDEVLGGVGDVLPALLLPLLRAVVLVRVVVPRHGLRLRVEGDDPPLGDGRVRGVPRYVVRHLGYVPGGCPLAGELRSVDVIPLRVELPQPVLQDPHRLLLLRVEVLRAVLADAAEERVLERQPQEVEGEEVHLAEVPLPVHDALGDQDVDVGVPLEVAAEGVEEAHVAEPPALAPVRQRRLGLEEEREGVAHRGEERV